MNGVQSEAGGSGPGPNGEDLDVVLGRFQAWAKTRREKPPTNYGASAGIAPRAFSGAFAGKGKLGGEARELSYEQALAASRYRRPVEVGPIEPPQPGGNPAKPVDEEAGGAGNRLPQAMKQDSRPAGGRSAQRAPTVEPAAAAAPEAASVKPAAKATQRPPRGASATVEVRSAGVEIDRRETITRNPTTENALPGRTAAAAAVKATPLPDARVVNLAAALPPVAVKAGTVAKPKPALGTSSALKAQRGTPGFREVLKGTAGLATTARAGAVAEGGKSIALALRVSDCEQARIQACAAQANLSVSAYLRQCALGVDELRDQVQLALSELHKQPAVAPPPGISAIPGILGRFAFGWLRRFRRGAEYSGLSLR